MPNSLQPFDPALHNIFCSHVAPWKKSLATPVLEYRRLSINLPRSGTGLQPRRAFRIHWIQSDFSELHQPLANENTPTEAYGGLYAPSVDWISLCSTTTMRQCKTKQALIVRN